MATLAAEPPLQQRKTESSEARQQFLKVFDEIREEVLADPMLVQKDASEWMARMLDHNVPGGKLNRGMAVKETLLMVLPSANEELQKQADFVGWAIELLQAYFLVADDIMDKSITRRGQPCWYRTEGVGLIAINDGILLECLLYFVLRKHVRGHAAYPHLLDLFLETTHQTAHGQLLDLITAPVGVPDLSRFSLERYMDIVTFKTAYYSFYLPVACGLHLAGITDAQAFSDAKAILIKMGQYFQIQDDVLDCFADPEVLGKIGTDIQDNKCSWLVCTALQQATAEQKEVIVQNYGQDDEKRIAVIKALFRDMEMEAKFQQLESTSYAELTAMIEAQTSAPREVYDKFLAKIYKRKK